MEPITWTGNIGTFLNPLLLISLAGMAIYMIVSLTVTTMRHEIASADNPVLPGGTAAMPGPNLASAATSIPFFFGVLLILVILAMVTGGDTGLGAFMPESASIYTIALVVASVILAIAANAIIPVSVSNTIGKVAAIGLLVVLVGYFLASLLGGVFSGGIIGAALVRFIPVWIALGITFLVSMHFKDQLGLYGKLFGNVAGMIGFGLVTFWVYTALFTGVFDLISTFDPLSQASGMKNKVPGTPLRGAEEGQFTHYLLGGDTLARDVFSRMVKGSVIVVQIAPLATLFAFMVGITLGLPAGFYGGFFDTFLSFLANLILAFPVILLFYLLVTPEIIDTGLPNYMAAVLFVFPILFLTVLINSRYYTRPQFRNILLGGTLAVSFLLYFSLISAEGTVISFWPMDLFDVPSGVLVVFVSVVFVNAPTVFRIVRGLAMDIKTRDYVSAAQTRGEGSWYIMLWEILPNARGPLIVDFCLRIGYTTILLGTLGFFGLGLPPESPDWGSTINQGRKLLGVYPHPALPPAFALMSLVLGLNLLADGLREESLKD